MVKRETESLSPLTEEVLVTGFQILSAVSFGPGSRYSLEEIQDRFGDRSWMVLDREIEDPLTGLPEIIRQAQTKEEALRGLLN